MPHADAHLNLIDSFRQLFELDSGAEIEAAPGYLFAAGRAQNQLTSNVAFRADGELEPAELLERAQSFFGARGRGFAVWARTGGPDRELIDAAEGAGLQAVYDMPEMVLDRPAEEVELPAGAELRRVASEEDAEAYWRVAADAYASIGFPAETFAFFDDHAGLGADNIAAFLARLDGRPAAIAMTVVSHGVAGIYWVGCVEEARERGLGRALTARAVNAGLEMGAATASLQASPMGASVYRQMGFETIYEYRMLLSMPPGEGG